MSQQDGPPPTGPQPAPKRGSPLLPGGWIALIVLGVVAFAFLAFGNRYREIACLVTGRSSATVIVAAAPPSRWHARRALGTRAGRPLTSA